jgi:septal ring factor EnvC (AmiA/AmiB activator)
VLVEEKENVLSDARVVQEQIQDVIQEGGQVLSPNIIAREEHPQELEMDNDHLASTLVQSEDELREEKSELTEQLDSYKQHDASRIALENSGGDVTDSTQML